MSSYNIPELAATFDSLIDAKEFTIQYLTSIIPDYDGGIYKFDTETTDNSVILTKQSIGYLYNGPKEIVRELQIVEKKNPPPLPQRIRQHDSFSTEAGAVVDVHCNFCIQNHKTEECPYLEFHNYSDMKEDDGGVPYQPRYYVWM